MLKSKKNIMIFSICLIILVVSLYAIFHYELQKTITLGKDSKYTKLAACDHDIGDYNWEIIEDGHQGTCTKCGATSYYIHNDDCTKVVTEPTCTEGGYTTYECVLCNYSFVGDYTNAVGHIWVDGICTECDKVCEHEECEKATMENHVCIICEKLLNHTWEDGQCTICGEVCTLHDWNNGVCTVCGKECTHEWEAETGICTECDKVCEHEECEKATMENHVCIICEKLLNHTWEDGQCTICGEVCTVHDWNNGVCTVCGKECTHEYDDGTIIKTPTCTEEGKRTYTCTVCEGTKTETIEKAAHSYEAEFTIDKEATCVEAGSKSKHCANCDAKTQITEIPATGVHTWNNGEVTKEATCEEEGIKTYTCTVCGGTKTETIEKAAHSYEAEFTIDKEATCVEAGSKSKHCANCDEKTQVTEIPATGVHTWNNGEVTKEATCEEEGIKTYTCTVCNGTKKEAIEKLGHNYEAQVTAPTCTSQGYTTHTCARCQDSYTDTYTNALGHNYENGKCTECGADEPKVSITSDEYIVDSLNCYITHIQPKTTIESFKNNINTNIGTEITIYEGNSIITDEVKYIKTGMTVKLEYGEDEATFTLVVRGDVDKDGEATFLDMIEINEHRLGKTTLDDICIMAGNVDETDNKIGFWDIIKINKYRLGKLLKL